MTLEEQLRKEERTLAELERMKVSYIVESNKAIERVQNRIEILKAKIEDQDDKA